MLKISKSEASGGGRSAHARPMAVTWSFWREFSNEARLKFSSTIWYIEGFGSGFHPSIVILKSYLSIKMPISKLIFKKSDNFILRYDFNMTYAGMKS